jgi:hypothetical protein
MGTSASRRRVRWPSTAPLASERSAERLERDRQRRWIRIGGIWNMEDGGWNMAGNADQSTGRSPEADPIRPGLIRGLRRGSGVKRGRRTLILVVGLMIVVVIIGVGLIVFSSISRESQSYKDGYSVGGAAYSTVGSADETAQYACKQEELRTTTQGGRPSRDNVTQWRKGCVNGFNTAQAGN